MALGKLQERTFNLYLEAALIQINPALRGLTSAERLKTVVNSDKVPDIIVRDRSYPPVIIESSFDANDADRDAFDRLVNETILSGEQHVVHTVVALHIPESFRDISERDDVIDALLGDSDGNGQVQLEYSVHRREKLGGGQKRWPRAGFISGTIYDLKTLLPHLSIPYEKVAEAGQTIAGLVKSAAQALDSAFDDQHKKAKLAELHMQRSPVSGMRTMMILWLNALLVQERLSQQSLTGLKVDPVHTSTKDRENEFIDPRVQLNRWGKIVKRNWLSIYAPAIKALEIASKENISATARSLFMLAECVQNIEMHQLGLHISVGAELFPVLSDDRKGAAAFYTRPSTAELLACLTIREEYLSAEEWKDPLLFSNVKIADMACGTGTLLRAGYRRVLDLHERFAKENSDPSYIHMGAMEGGVIGADISPIAAHLTTSSMASLGKGDSYGDTQIGWVQVGWDGYEFKAGSLQYFETDKVVNLFTSAGIGATSGTGVVETVSVEIPFDKIDWILMNPPYSRAQGGKERLFKIAGMSPEESEGVTNQRKKLLKNQPVNLGAGDGATFLALARLKVKVGGRIGFVLPLTAGFSSDWAKVRKLIRTEFEDIVAVTVLRKTKIKEKSFSADTGMGEMLLIATKLSRRPRLGPIPPNPVHCVTLSHPPLREGEAGEIGRAIYSAVTKAVKDIKEYPVRIGDDEFGTVAILTSDDPDRPWSYLGAKHIGLAMFAEILVKGRVVLDEDSAIDLPVSMSILKDIFDIGYSHHTIGHYHKAKPKDKIGAYEFHPISDTSDAIGNRRALWGANKNTQAQLIVLPTHKGFLYLPDSEEKREKIDKVRKKVLKSQSTLFYARGMQWTSQKLLAASTERRCSGGRAWTSLSHRDPRVLKAYALWGNSTLGFLIHWTRGQRQQGGRASTQVGAISDMPSPRIDLLDEQKLSQAAQSFRELSYKPLSAACRAHMDDTRKQIDDAVLDMLGINSSEVARVIDDMRWLWCNEPSVHGNNRAALRALEDAQQR